MALPENFRKVTHLLKETIIDNRFSVYLAGFTGRNITQIFVEKEENGYSRTKDGVKIKMSRSMHFTDILIRKPLEGYRKEVNLEEVDTMIDAGAFPGEFAIYAAKKENVDVIALEPDPENADQLRENIRLNGLEDSITVLEKGLWKEKDEKGFERDRQLGMASKISENTSITIDLDKLDNIVSEHEKPDLVKMDIEGAEIEALKGAEKVLEEVRPKFSIATYHRRDGKKTFKKVEEILEQHSYTAETGYSRHLTTYGEPVEPSED
ncbi:MAG: FkbM family methyltransferase [Candidatus Nanosalina sp.]